MGTIRPRKRKDNTTAYCAQIRINRDGQPVYQETQMFDRKQVVQAWMKRHGAELALPGATNRLNRKSVTVKQMIDQYLDEYEKVRPLGKAKRATLVAISNSWLGAIADSVVTSQKLVEYAQRRMSKEGGSAQAQTVGNDLSHLGAVLPIARPAWGYDMSSHAMADARTVLRKLGMVSKSKERTRRPTQDELAAAGRIKASSRSGLPVSRMKSSSSSGFSQRLSSSSFSFFGRRRFPTPCHGQAR